MAVAKVWKNGIVMAPALSNGQHDATGNSVYVSGNDVYVAGFESNGSKYVAKVWKNGIEMAPGLSNGQLSANASSVFVVKK